jgi:endonuclease/exonuclease/phosphatase family metal-dependent hydrolase
VPVSILTLNLWHDSGPWKERAVHIGELVDELAPDLIGFQEVLSGPGVDLAAELLEGRGYHLDFGAASSFRRAGEQELWFGNAVASRWPILARDELRLPDAGDAETRSALRVTADSPSGPISFTSTHLNWRLHHGWVREDQVMALCDFVRAGRPKDGFPPVLVGDFNAEPDSTEIRYVSGLQSLEGRSTYFVDAWRAAGEDGPGLTWSNRNDYARPWFEPDRRIDYVFVGPPRRDGVGRILACRVVGNQPRNGIWPSDHFGIFARLESEPGPGLESL